MEREEPLFSTVQNAAEFWNAATRPAANNGLGYSIEEAQEQLTAMEGFFEIVNESAASYEALKAILITYRVSGVQVHDARLVAIMQSHGLKSILTFNTADSRRFPGIEVVHPADILPAQSSGGTMKKNGQDPAKL